MQRNRHYSIKGINQACPALALPEAWSLQASQHLPAKIRQHIGPLGCAGTRKGHRTRPQRIATVVYHLSNVISELSALMPGPDTSTMTMTQRASSVAQFVAEVKAHAAHQKQLREEAEGAAAAAIALAAV